MVEMVRIVHNDYEKISDTCMWLSKDYVLKFTVELNRHPEHKKENYYKEYGYISQDGDYRVNISREINSYLSIESLRRSYDGNKIQLRIGINEIYFFKYKLKEVVSWFVSDQYKNLFVKKDGRIIIPTKIDSVISKVMYDCYIEFEPSVITLPNNEQIIGAKIYLNSDSIFFFMDVNTLLSFSYFIDTFNMYQSAQLMLAYLGKPENGTNYVDYIPSQKQYKESNGFFNRVNAKKE